MKKSFILLLALMFASISFAQAPQAFNYQGIARDLTGNPVVNKNIGLRISILQGSVNGPEAFKELHLVSTNNTGLFNIQIGKGTIVNTPMELVKWEDGPFFLKIEMDTNGGSNYQLVGTNQLVSVPYAIHAKTAENVSNPIWMSSGNNIYYNKGNVGIGTNRPESKLHISNGDVSIPNGSLYFGKLLKIGDYEANTHANHFEWNENSIIYSRYLHGLYGNMVIQANSTEYASSINFVTGSSVMVHSNPPALRMVIMGNGNVGIGKIPTTLLDVNGLMNVNNHRITNVADPIEQMDAVNKAYVDILKEKILELEAKVGAKDIDGNEYDAVKIGNQVWMAENLRTTKYRDGSPIPYVVDAAVWAEQANGAYCFFFNNESIGKIYGPLYNYYTVIDERGLCPAGWHVPTDADWTILREYLGGEDIAGGKLKAIGTEFWGSPNVGADNSSGFNALGASWRGEDGAFYYDVRHSALFWTTTEFDAGRAWSYHLSYGSAKLLKVNGPYHYKKAGHSVRCIKD